MAVSILPLFAVILILHSGPSSSLTTTENWKHLNVPCNTESLSFRNVTNKTDIHLDHCTFNLRYPLHISNINDLRIIGSGNGTVINCTSDNAGLLFKSVNNLLLESLIIQNCGVFSDDRLQIASVRIVGGENVYITVMNVTIENGTGTGLSLINVSGVVTVKNCTFRRNIYYVDRMYQVVNATHNDFTQRGGGMQIQIGVEHRSVYLIQRCKFLFNFASSGGGLFVVVQLHASNHSITVENSDFIKNKCQNGGGGVQFGYTALRSSSKQVNSNSIMFQNCVFRGNEARYGGGTAIFSSLGTPLFSENKIQMNNSSWSNNTASKLGMAVDIAIAPWETFSRNGLFPKPLFSHCNFTEHTHYTFLSSPRSIFTLTGFRIDFKDTILFERNTGTAIEANLAELNFTENSYVKFGENRGVNGGAVSLKGLSVIFIYDHSTLVFQDNSALKKGGAIYVDSSGRHSESVCFIQRRRKKQFHASFVFDNNTAGFENFRHRGDSIYASSLLPCLGKCSQLHDNVSVSRALACIGKFKFDLVSPRRQITSAAHHFSRSDTLNEQDPMCNLFMVNDIIYSNKNYVTRNIDYHINESLYVTPGNTTKIPLKLVDELCGEVSFRVSVEVLKSDQGSIFIDSTHSIITDNYITIHGDPNDFGTLQFSAVGVRCVTLSVKLNDCPPGYIHNNSTKNCVCSLATLLHYDGIERCSETNFTAYTKHGYWLGYLKNPNKETRQDRLASAICPKGFCTTNSSSEYPLPSVALDDLSSYICNETRRGIICGSCKENNSAYYRSTSFSCKPNDLCYLGWLFYILSEIIPVTFLFFIVIYFNLSFTSGALNGIIFFIQVIGTFKIDGENFIQFPEGVKQLSRIYKLVYRIFLLKFFALEEVSFCLWEGATALDMLAFRYVTIMYSLFLVIFTVILLKKRIFSFHCCHLSKQLKKEQPNLKHSILNGLSAFLVMSYSECTRVSLMILTTGTLTVGPTTKQKFEPVVFYNGEYSFMGKEHLKYALPALFFLFTIVAVPPMLLIIYPLCYKLFALLRINESKCVQITCKVIPLEKIKPMFDSIQGAFKDQYRFFAGLYFVYRLGASLTFSFPSALKTYYTATSAQLIFMLMVHAVCCPYRQKWHNILDALLFSILAMINAISFFNYERNQSDVTYLAGVQCVLILLPLVYLVIYTTYKIYLKIKTAMASCSKRNDTEDEDDNLNGILDMVDSRIIEQADVGETKYDYMLY